MHLIRLSAALLISFLLSACSTYSIPSNAETTIIAMRHADRSGENLNSKGEARANALPAAVSNFDIKAIYSPDIARNIATAKPLSSSIGIPITLIPKEKAGARMTSDYPDGTVVWIGNKDNLRDLWAELKAPSAAPQKYGELFILKMRGATEPDVERRFLNAP